MQATKIVFTLIFLAPLMPLTLQAQSKTPLQRAMMKFENEMKALIGQEAKQRQAAIALLRKQLRQLAATSQSQAGVSQEEYQEVLDRVLSMTEAMSELREQLDAQFSQQNNSGNASYAAASVSNEEADEYRIIAQELQLMREQIKSTMRDNPPAGQPQSILDKLTINGQVRFRQEIDRKKFTPDTDVDEKSQMRSRLGLRFEPAEGVIAFLQFQDSRTFGAEGGSTLANGSNIDLHQGYIMLQNAFGSKGLTLKVGRQEIIFGGQRLMGAVGWHNVGRAFDAGRLTLNRNGWRTEVWAAKLAELFEAGESKDNLLYGLDISPRSSSGFKPRAYVIFERNSQQDENGFDLLSRNTWGAHAKGNLSSFDYEIETAFQSGKQVARDISASMLGLAFGYTLPTVRKARLSVGYDYLSGNDGTPGKVKVFNTLYATNHKFYGYMDYFLNIPVHTQGLGLKDYMVKSSVKLSPKVVGKADLHFFTYAREDAAGQKDLGKELDLTVVYKFRQPLKVVAGASAFSPGDVYKRLQGDRLAFKFYSMMILNL